MVIEASTGQAHQMADDGDVQRRERGFAGIMPQHAGGHEENEQSPTGEGGDEGGMITKCSRHPDGRRVETAYYVEKTTKRKPAVYKSYDIWIWCWWLEPRQLQKTPNLPIGALKWGSNEDEEITNRAGA